MWRKNSRFERLDRLGPATRYPNRSGAYPAPPAVQHLTHRPSWTCTVCTDDTPWPCPPARVQLAEEYGTDRVALAVYMGSLLEEAAAEVQHVPSGELYERFVAWTRR